MIPGCVTTTDLAGKFVETEELEGKWRVFLWNGARKRSATADGPFLLRAGGASFLSVGAFDNKAEAEAARDRLIAIVDVIIRMAIHNVLDGSLDLPTAAEAKGFLFMDDLAHRPRSCRKCGQRACDCDAMMVCPECGGDGRFPPCPQHPCTDCDGTGKVKVVRRTRDDSTRDD